MVLWCCGCFWLCLVARAFGFVLLALVVICCFCCLWVILGCCGCYAVCCFVLVVDWFWCWWLIIVVNSVVVFDSLDFC